jgi:hypothetical protein
MLDKLIGLVLAEDKFSFQNSPAGISTCGNHAIVRYSCIFHKLMVDGGLRDIPTSFFPLLLCEKKAPNCI